jgi:hypothetical protein
MQGDKMKDGEIIVENLTLHLEHDWKEWRNQSPTVKAAPRIPTSYAEQVLASYLENPSPVIAC